MGNSVQCSFNEGTPSQCKNRVDLSRSNGNRRCSFHRNFTGNSGMQSTGVSLATMHAMSRMQPTRFQTVQANGRNAMNAAPVVTVSPDNPNAVEIMGWTPWTKINWQGQEVSIPYHTMHVTIEPGERSGYGTLRITDLHADEDGVSNDVIESAIQTSRRYYHEHIADEFGLLDGSSTSERYYGGVPQMMSQLNLGADKGCNITIASADDEQQGDELPITERIRCEFPDASGFKTCIRYWPSAQTDKGELAPRWKIDKPETFDGSPLTEDQVEIAYRLEAIRQVIGQYEIPQNDGSVIIPPSWTERDPSTFDDYDDVLRQNGYDLF